MEKLLHLYKYVDGVNDSPFPSKEQQATLYEFKYDAKRMGNAPTITGTLMHPLCLDELWGNNEVYVSYNGERYFIKQTPTSSYSNDDTRYKHECDFVSERVLLNDVYFYDVVTSDVSNDKPVSNSSNVVFYGDIHELAKRLNYSLQYAKLEYSVVVDEGITSESKLVSFQKQFFANVLQEGYKLFEIPYYFEGKVIHFGYTNNTIDKLFSYGAKDALLSISKNNITQRIVNRITGVGSADNIPYYYPNFDPKGVSEVLYNGKANNLVSVENLIKYKKVKLGDTFIYNYESDKVIEYVDKSKYVVSKDITLLSENYETTKRYELVLDFPFSVDIAPQSSIVELDYSKTFLTKFKARLYRNLELRDTFTSFGETPYYRLIEGEYNFSISLEFTFGEFDEKTELTESDIPSIVDALTISITSDVSGFEQWTLNTANNIVKLSDYGLKLNTSPKNGDKITFKQLSYIPPQPNLMPPIYRETLGAERFYNALNNTYYDRIMGSYYSFDNLFMVGKNKEDDVLFEDIKPSIKGVTNSYYERIDVFSEFAWDENDNDEFDEEGNYLHPYFFGKLRLFDGEFGFNLFDHAIEEDEMVISMTSGSCGGCNFIIGVDDESQKNIVQVDENGNLKRDANGNVLYGSPQERQNDTSKYEVWVALKKDIETFGVIMPNATNNYRPSAGDTFVILHIDLPNAYILAAEERLREELIKYMKENNSEKFNFSLSFSRIFFAENPTILAQLNENARIKIAYNNNAYTLYVSSYSYSMNADTALPEIRVELSEELAIVKESIVKQLANASLYLNKEVQRVNTSVATTNTTISKNTATAQASITKTNARVENVEKVVMNLQSNSGGGGGQGGINEEQLENYLTTNQYAKKSDIPSLDAYAKSDDVANTYATKSALKGVSDSVSTLREDFDNLSDVLNGNVGGVIDTWNEVVSFLDGYSQSDDLAAILSGMNTDIANRVLIEDFEKLEEAVNPLFGYFDATGNANNALKLGGHSAEYFATATAVNTLTTDLNSLVSRVSINEQGIATNKTNIATLVGQVKGLADDVEILKGYWYIDNDGNLHTTHNIVVDGGGAFGKGSGGGGDVPSGGGIDETQLWNILGTSGTKTIHSSHIPDLSGKYLSVSGGTIENSSFGYHLSLIRPNSSKAVGIHFGNSIDGNLGYIGVGGSGNDFGIVPFYRDISNNYHTLLHSSNYSNYALPKSGGTMQGDIILPERKYIRDADNTAIFGYNTTQGLLVGSPSKKLSLRSSENATLNGNTLYHTGNFNPNDYLPLSGGTLTGDIKTKSYASGTDGLGLYIEGYSNLGLRIQYNKSTTGRDYDQLLLKDGVLKFNSKEVIHIGNYTTTTDSRYLQLSGGTITGNTDALKIRRNGKGYSAISYYNTDGAYYNLLGVLGYDSNGNAAAYSIGANTWHTLIHSGNIGSQSVSYASSAGNADTLDGIDSSNLYYASNIYETTDLNAFSRSGVFGTFDTNPNIPNFGGSLYYHRYSNGAYQTQIFGSLVGNRWYARTYISDWRNWREFAFTDSNVASATKLQTARTIWGQSFDGTGNVSGALYDTSGQEFIYSSGNLVRLGTGTAAKGCNTYIDGNNIYLRYGTAYKDGIALTSSGNALIGSTEDSGQKLKVAGSIVADLGNTGGVLIGGNGNSIDGYVNGALTELHLNYTSPSNISMCRGGGKVLIGTTTNSGAKVVIDHNDTYPLMLNGSAKYSVISYYSRGTAVADIGWLNEARGNLAYVANISSGGVISVDNSGVYYTDDTSIFKKYRVSILNIDNSLSVKPTGVDRYYNIGTLDASWSGSKGFGLIWSSANTSNTGDIYTMIAMPHIPYLEKNKRGYTGETYGAIIRFESDIADTAVWDIGTKNDTFSIVRGGKYWFNIFNNNNGAFAGTTKIPESAWKGTLVVGADSYNKAVIGYCTSSTNGVVFGGHNSTLSEWAPVSISGSVVYLRYNEAIKGTIHSSGFDVTGNLAVTGGGAFGSDIRYKNIISYRQIDLETIVNAPLFSFRWTDREDKEQHLGTSAQYWLGTQFKDAVNTANKDFYHLDYGALAVGVGISVAREVKVVKTEVELLRDEVRQLKKKLNKYEQVWHN